MQKYFLTRLSTIPNKKEAKLVINEGQIVSTKEYKINYGLNKYLVISIASKRISFVP